jgi:hypothetical protein
LRVAQLAIEQFLAHRVERASESTVPTFKALDEQWTSGALAKRYPDHITVKRSVKDDIGRFTKHIYPIIGGDPRQPRHARSHRSCDAGSSE